MKKYISIIVPVYKVEKYLDKCVNSLLTQDLSIEQYEIILVDDGSPDQCGAKCDEYAEKYSNVQALHKKNGGLSDARNYGFKYAQGKYILFVDSDDYIEENCLGSIVAACQTQGEPDILFLQAQKVYPDASVRKYDDIMNVSELNKDKQSALYYLANRRMYPASAWSKMVRKEVLEDNAIEFKVGQLSEDYEWSLALYLKAASFGAYNKNYYYYRQNREGSITAGVSEKHFVDLLEIVDTFEKTSLKNKEQESIILSFAAYIYRTALWYAPKYYKKYKSKIKEKKYLLEKRDSKDVRMIRNATKMIGMGGTIRLLELYGKLRR